MPDVVFQSVPPYSPEIVTRPTFKIPARGCDAHMHVFGPAEGYPAATGARYTLPQASAQSYARTAAAIGIERAVFVQPSFYGSDNSFLLDQLDLYPDTRRGVVIIGHDTSSTELSAWNARGVRAMRLDFFKARADGSSIRELERNLLCSCDRAAQLGWSVDLYVPGAICWALAPVFEEASCPLTIAHMGLLTPSEGLSDSQCIEFVDMVQKAPVWAKLTGAYRYGPGSGLARAQFLTRALLGAIPSRLLWGSDWPHVMSPAQDSGELLNAALGDAAPSVVADILVHNPARLYGFDPS